MDPHGQTHPLAALQRRQEVQAFEQAICGVLVRPPPKLVLVGGRRLLKGVVNNSYPRLALHLTDQRLNGPPPIGRRFLGAGQGPGHLLVADFPLQPLAQPRRRSRPKRRQHVLGIQVGSRGLFHPGEATPFSRLSRKVSHSTELLLELTGPWIHQIGEDQFEVSPLLSNTGQTCSTPEFRRACIGL